MNEPKDNQAAQQSPIVARVTERFGEAVLGAHADHGDHTVIVDPKRIVEVITYLNTAPGLEFNVLMDLCGVDCLPRRPRFEVVYHLYSLKHSHRLRLKVQLGGPEPETDSITSLYKVANWLEREVWDMFGITFRGHPDLRRILMYEQFEGHPLRRDYPYNKRQPIVNSSMEHR